VHKKLNIRKLCTAVPGHVPDTPVDVQLLFEADPSHELEGQLMRDEGPAAAREHHQLIVFVQDLLARAAIPHHLIPLLLQKEYFFIDPFLKRQD
jgi:hypothetical protein